MAWLKTELMARRRRIIDIGIGATHIGIRLLLIMTIIAAVTIEVKWFTSGQESLLDGIIVFKFSCLENSHVQKAARIGMFLRSS